MIEYGLEQETVFIYERNRYKIMRIKLLCAIIAFAVCTTASFAQSKHSDAHVTGHVTDGSTGEHLPFVSISVKGTVLGTTTDATGHFLLLNVPVGEQTLVASFVGYEREEQIVMIIADKTIEVKFDIHQQTLDLADVVVTASRYETNRREAATVVNMLSSRSFELTGAASTANVLNFLPGLRVETYDRTCGASELKINGLSGQYTQILIDSRPIFSTLAGVYGLEQLPAGMIERVEVIRGGGSALFGSSAIGGVVNIITKEPLRNTFMVSNNTGFFGDKFGGSQMEVNTSFNGSFVTDDYKAGVYLYGIARSRDPYDRSGDGFTDAPKTQSETLGFRGYYRLTDYSRLTAEYHHIHEYRRGGDNLDRPPHETYATEELRHYINGGGLNYDLFSVDHKQKLSVYTSMQGIKRETYFGTFQDLDAYGSSTDFSFVAGSQYSYWADNFLFMPSQFIAGVEYTNNSLEDIMPSYERFIDQFTETTGAFFQNEWKNQLLSLVVGGRLDKNNRIDGVIFSPRINARYTPLLGIGLRAGWSSGYRAPQVFQEDLHIGAIGGEAALISVDPNLKPEYSNSFNFSVDWNKRFNRVETNLLIDFFYTTLKDVFVLEERGIDINNHLLFERTNASGAVVQGVNLEFKTGIATRFTADVGFTFQRSRYKEPHEWSPEIPAGKIMLRSPDQYGYLMLNYFPVKRLTVSATGNYTGSMLYPHYEGYIEKDAEKWTPSFFDAGLRLAYDFQITNQFSLQISSGMKNIFDQFQKDIDEGPLRDATYIYGPTMPRMIYFGVKVAM